MDLSTTDLSPADLADVAGKLRQATGGAAPTHALGMLCELADAAGPGGGPDEPNADGEARVIAALEAAMALAPRDPLEGMLVAQMAAVNAAAMRCLRRAAECAEYPKIEALYLREAARMLHLFQRQSETLDRRARRLDPPKRDRTADAGEEEAGDADAGDAAAAPDGAQVLEKLLADLRARMRERAAQGTEKTDRRSGIRGGDFPIPDS